MAKTNLVDVWRATPEALAPVLSLEGKSLTDNINHDRVNVALIYYNNGDLSSDDMYWLEWPGFMEICMKPERSYVSLSEIQLETITPFLTKLLNFGITLHMYKGMYLSIIKTTKLRDKSAIEPIIDGYLEDDSTFMELYGNFFAPEGEIWRYMSMIGHDHASFAAVSRILSSKKVKQKEPTILGGLNEYKDYIAVISEMCWEYILTKNVVARDPAYILPEDFKPSSLYDSFMQLVATQKDKLSDISKCYVAYVLHDLYSELPIPQDNVTSTITGKVHTISRKPIIYPMDEKWESACKYVWEAPDLKLDISDQIGGITKTSLNNIIGNYVGVTYEEAMKRLLRHNSILMVTLEEIWSSSKEELEQLILEAGIAKVKGISNMRATVAMNYYESKQLWRDDIMWVIWPDFIETLQTVEMDLSLQQTKNIAIKAFITKLFGYIIMMQRQSKTYFHMSSQTEDERKESIRMKYYTSKSPFFQKLMELSNLTVKLDGYTSNDKYFTEVHDSWTLPKYEPLLSMEMETAETYTKRISALAWEKVVKASIPAIPEYTVLDFKPYELRGIFGQIIRRELHTCFDAYIIEDLYTTLPVLKEGDDPSAGVTVPLGSKLSNDCSYIWKSVPTLAMLPSGIYGMSANGKQLRPFKEVIDRIIHD